MSSSPSSPSRSPRIVAALSLLPLALASACTDEPGPTIEPAPVAVEESALRASLDAWKPQLRKGCSLDDVFGAAPAWSAHTRPDERTIDLDVAQVIARLGGRLWARDAAGELVVLSAPAFRRHTGFETRGLPVRAADGSQRDAALGATLDDDNQCVITMDGVEVFRGTLWEELPVIAQVAAPVAGKDLASREDRADVFVNPQQTGTAYLEIDALDAVTDAFFPHPDRAAAVLAPRLGLSDAETAFYVVREPVFLTHVEADAASAPFPLLEVSAADKPVDWYTSPTIPVEASRIADWLPAQGAVIRTLRVDLPRPALAIAGLNESADRPLQVSVRVSLEALADDKVRARVLDVGEPREIAGGAAAARACVHDTATAALTYVARPAMQLSGVPTYPMAVVLGFGPSASATWILAPCGALTADLPAALRTDAASATDLVTLLDRGAYAGPKPDRGIQPRGWDAALAAIATDDTALGVLEHAQGGNAVMTAALHAQHVLFGQQRYQHADDGERLRRRVLVWRNGLLCGADLADADIGVLLDVPADKLDQVIADTTTCPWPH